MKQINTKLRIFFYSLIMVNFLSCNKDKIQFIDPEFDLFVDAFFLDANSRGLKMKKEDFDLTIQFKSLENSDGECHFHNNGININKDQWQNLDFENKKWLIYHELGHCILKRKIHKNGKSINGECLSIMRGKENGFSCSFNLYSSKWWKYYVDELFNEETAFPFWEKSKEKFDITTNLKFELNIDTTTNYIEMIELDSNLFSNTFKIIVNLKNLSDDDNIFKIYLGNIGFSYCSKCIGVNIRINTDLPNNTYYENFEKDFFDNKKIELSLLKSDDCVSFFVNERFIHIMESNLLTSSNIIKTIQFNNEVDLSVKIQQYE